MNRDLTELLREWPFEPGRINVRVIRGSDGEPLIQVRLDLGLLQMRTEGRPDGQRPHGFDSLLDYHEDRLDKIAEFGLDPDAPSPRAAADDETSENAEADHEPDPDASEPASFDDGDDRPPAGGLGDRPADAHPIEDDAPAPAALQLGPDACRELREEAVQYYHRYIALLVVDDYEGVVRDTTRNLRVLDLCRKHAATPEDRAAMEQFRPYIMMMRARAAASQALKDNEPKAAIFAIDQGLETLKDYFTDLGHPEAFEASSEADMLRGMREALVPKLPVSQKTELRQRLQEALERENYELAAILRDELRLIRE
ncbi:MAG: hypothetical protein EA378_02845 [Phycisphaerales bacterium]|nr:MAG: hypothetical protein EA378_02845 [Phycisphaerales bacterium]